MKKTDKKTIIITALLLLVIIPAGMFVASLVGGAILVVSLAFALMGMKDVVTKEDMTEEE